MTVKLKIDAKITIATLRQAIEEMLKKAPQGAASKIDKDGDGDCDLFEAAHFIYHNSQWKHYLPELQKMGFNHPLAIPGVEQRLSAKAKKMPPAQLARDFYIEHAERIGPKHKDFVISLAIASCISPNHYRVHAQTARLADYEGRKEQAVLAQREAIRTKPNEYIFFKLYQYFIKKLKPAETLILARSLVNDYPKSAYALEVLASICVEQNKCDTVGKDLQKSMSRSGNGHVLQAFKAIKDNDLKRARSLISNALIYNPNNALALRLAAELDIANGDWSAAEKHIKASIKGAPRLQGSHAILSSIYQSQGKTKEAMLAIKKEAQSFNGNPLVLLNMAQSYLAQGSASMAFGYAKTFAHLVPNNPAGHYMLSDISFIMGDVASSKASAKTALKLVGSNKAFRADIYSQLSGLALVEGDLKTAIKYAGDAMSDNPNSFQVRLAKYSTLVMENKPDEALKVAQGLTQKFSKMPSAWGLAATSYYSVNRHKDAEKAVAETLKKNPKDMNALQTQILLLVQKGKISEARTVFNKLTSSYPGFVALYGTFAYSAYLLNENKIADDFLKRSLPYFPNDNLALLTQGLRQIDKNELAAAEATAKKMDRLYPALNSATFLLAKIYYKQGKLAEAEKAARKAIKMNQYDNDRIPVASAKHLLKEILKAQSKK